MPKFTTLSLEFDPPSRDPMFDAGRAVEESAGNQLRYAFLALLAANIFVISGGLCFALLCFLRQ